MSLQALVAQHNNMDSMFFGGKDQWNVNPTPEMAQAMFSRLDSNLSPEALYADGERPRAQAQKLAKQYRAAIAELKAKGFQPAGEMYNV
jgi:hypothetical protein